MIVSNNFNGGDMLGELADQLHAAEDRRTEAASPADYLRWVSQTLRDQKAVYENLKIEHEKLTNAAELATVGLRRLGTLVKFKDRVSFEHLSDLHRDFTFKNKNIHYTLVKCKQVLDATTMNMQFVGETLNSALADRQKKKAVQKELGLRLRDSDADFARCQKAVAAQKKTHRQLSEALQVLMNKTGIKLPPQVRQTMHREDEVAKIAIRHKKSLEKGRDVLNTTPYVPSGIRDHARSLSDWSVSNLGAEAEAEATEAETSKTEETKDSPPTTGTKLDPKIAIVSLVIGLIFGSLFFFRDAL